MDEILFSYFPLIPLGWIVLQVAAVRKLRGGWRAAAWVPVAAMGLALAVAIAGVSAGSNLAPIWVVLALPFCLAWIVGLWVLRSIVWLFVRLLDV